MPNIRTKIPNPYASFANRELAPAQVYIDPAHHLYFSRGVCAGSPGALNAILANLISKFYAECQQRNIEPKWTPDGEQQLIAALSDLNFTRPPGKRPSPRRSNPPVAQPPA